MKVADGQVIRITATPARHGPAGIEPLSGDVIGFVLSFADNKKGQGMSLTFLCPFKEF